MAMTDSKPTIDDGRAAIWAALIEDLRAVCWEAGWVCATHGSMIHDLDLILLPWHDDAVSTLDIIKRIGDLFKQIEPFMHMVHVVERPFHRQTYTINIWGDAHLDISVVDVREQWDASAVEPETV